MWQYSNAKLMSLMAAREMARRLKVCCCGLWYCTHLPKKECGWELTLLMAAREMARRLKVCGCGLLHGSAKKAECGSKLVLVMAAREMACRLKVCGCTSTSDCGGISGHTSAGVSCAALARCMLS